MQILESLQEVCQHIGHELHYATYDGNAYMVFCSQYGQTSPNGGIYEYDTQFKAELNSGAYQRIAEYIYCGYTMKHGAGLPNSAQARKDACLHNSMSGNILEIISIFNMVHQAETRGKMVICHLQYILHG